MRPLNDVLLANAIEVIYMIYDYEDTQNTRYSEIAKAHVPILVCVQQFCCRFEDVEDDVDSLRQEKVLVLGRPGRVLANLPV